MIGRILAMAIGLFGALAGSQLPEFGQQYRQRLGGAIDELTRVVDRFDQSAQASGLSREQAITRLGEQADPLVRRQGEAVGDMVQRLGRLQHQRDSFAQSGPFERVVVLLRDMDPALARSAYLDFEPAVPATSEGVVAGGTGFVVGWGIVLFLARLLGRLRPRAWSRRRDVRTV